MLTYETKDLQTYMINAGIVKTAFNLKTMAHRMRLN
jgi:hypothetical protein